MNPILQAMASGYSINKILKYLSSSNPQLASKISSAVSYGYTANQILKYVMQGGSSANSNLPKASKMDMNLYDKMQYSIPEDIENVAQMGLGLGAAGLGYFASQMGNQAGTPPAQQPNTPAPITNIPPPNAPTPAPIMPGNNIGQQINNQINQPTNPAQVATAAQAIPPPQPQNPMQQGVQPQGQVQPQSIFDQLLTGVDIPSLDKSKQQQLQFFKTISNQMEAQGKTIDDPEVKKLAANIKKTLQGNPSIMTEELSRDTQAKPIEKSSIVSTPQGVGEVKGVSGGKALVEINGKTHKIDEKEIEQPPIPEKDLADLHNDLIAGIEKATGKEVSKHVDWVGYDPVANELQYKPWGGASYTYGNIQPEDVDMLTNVLTQRKTTGSNWIGGWEANTDSPIGAAMHNLITKLKEEAKSKGVKEYTRKYETVYSAREPAEQAAKLKKKLAEQEKRKKEKDAKKAKK